MTPLEYVEVCAVSHAWYMVAMWMTDPFCRKDWATCRQLWGAALDLQGLDGVRLKHG